MSVSALCVAFASEGGVAPATAFVQRVLARGPAERVMMFYATADTEHSEPVEELLALKDRHVQRFSLSFLTQREPDEAELITGPLDAAKVQALAGKLFDARSVSEFVVCGPQALVDDVTAGLTSLGVGAGHIHAHVVADVAAATMADAGATAMGKDHPSTHRSHAPLEAAPATPSQTSSASAAPTAAHSTLPAKGTVPETRVELVMDGRRRAFTMHTGTESILDAAARAGIELPFSCKAGVCATCRTKLVRGEVDLAQNYALEDWELEQGFILACQAHAKTPEIELTYDEK
jgi:ring-1,2-phenylacetyl-CoA epoxidase subunit PaaE